MTAGASVRAGVEKSESLLICGKVITLDAESRIAEAIAIRGDRIVAVGARRDIEARGRFDRIVETDGVIIPGFNDTHAHMDTEGLRGHFPSLAGARSISDVLARIEQLARDKSHGEWIITMPVGEPPFFYGGPLTLDERRMPTRYELDRAAPDNPVCILPPSSYWGLIPCFAAVNSEALTRLGIDRSTQPRIPGIEIMRDESGEPTGIFVERNYPDAMQLDLLAGLPRITSMDRRRGIIAAMRTYHSHGITSIYEGHGCASEIIDAYRGMRQQECLSMRVGAVVSPTWSSLDDAERQMKGWLAHARGSGLGDPFLRVSGIYINYGGEPAVGSLAMSDPGNLGWSCYVRQANDPETFEKLCLLAARYDLRVHTVVIDKLHEIVPILQRIDAQYGISSKRWVLEHISVARMDDLAALRSLGVGVTLIPEFHLYKAGGRFANLSDEECALVAPAVQLAQLGVPVSAGTDNSPVNPLASMRAMMTRRQRTTGRILGASSRASAELALRCLTVNGAWLTFEEGRKGAICVGNYADLAVLSDDPLTTPPEDLENISCRATLVAGRFVYGSADDIGGG